MAPPPVRQRGLPPPAPPRTLDQLLDEPCPAHKEMRHTLRNCCEFKTMLARGRLFTPEVVPPPPPPQRIPPPPRNQPPQQPNTTKAQRFPEVNRKVNFILGGHGAATSKRHQKLEAHRINMASLEPPMLYSWSDAPISFSREDQWLNLNEPGKYPLLENPVIGDTRLRKVLIDGGASINVVFPKALQVMGVPFSALRKSDTPFFGIVPGAGELPLGHIYLAVTFGTELNFRLEMLRFEVPSFNCIYNTIIGRPGLAKFMALPHYPYLILKMPAPAGTLTIRADLKGASECVQEAIQTALDQGSTVERKKIKADAASLSQEDLQIPVPEATSSATIQTAVPTKEVPLDLEDPSKTTSINAFLPTK